MLSPAQDILTVQNRGLKYQSYKLNQSTKYIIFRSCCQNVTRLEIGPQTFIRQDNERVVFGPDRMITVPPRHYCIIENPVVRDADGKVVTDGGQAKLYHADQDIRYG